MWGMADNNNDGFFTNIYILYKRLNDSLLIAVWAVVRSSSVNRNQLNHTTNLKNSNSKKYKYTFVIIILYNIIKNNFMIIKQ